MNFEIIIIDDNMQSSDPFVRRLEKVFQDARVILFPDVRESLDYIFDNLSKKLIVFLDCKFDTGLQGIDGLKRIREKTSLLYIVMMSANSPLQQPTVYQFDDARIIQSERRTVYVLPVWIVSYAKNLRFLGVVDAECKIVSRHDPVELR